MIGTSSALLFIQGRLHPGQESVYARYLEGTRPLMAEYRAEIVVVGEGIDSEQTTDAWPVNAVLSFPDRQHAEGFLADPRYQALAAATRDVAYETLHLSLVAGRAPKARSAKTVAEEAFEEFRHGLAEGVWQPFLGRLTDDFVFRFPFGAWQGTHHGKDRAAAFFQFVSAAYAEGLTVTEVERVTAEADRVVFEFQDEGLLRGTPYANVVAISLDVRGEQICGYREYFGVVGPPPAEVIEAP